MAQRYLLNLLKIDNYERPTRDRQFEARINRDGEPIIRKEKLVQKGGKGSKYTIVQSVG